MTEYYQPLKVEALDLKGVWPSLKAMRLPKGTEPDSFCEGDYVVLGPSDARLAAGLVKAGADHAKFSRGIIVWLELQMQAGFMIEFETYRHGVECLSTTSSMHGELKGKTGLALAEQKQRDLSAKVYTRIVAVSYQALRAMYRARRNHRHPDWQVFCDFIETLPFFDIMIYPEAHDAK